MFEFIFTFILDSTFFPDNIIRKRSEKKKYSQMNCIASMDSVRNIGIKSY
jgi:hypothetical protein